MMHAFYDLEIQIPKFFHIIPAKVNDTSTKDVITYEVSSIDIYDIEVTAYPN